MVIAVVFNSEKHEGYAVPPNENPFDAYYVDETVASIPSVDDIAPQLQIINPKEGYLHIFGKDILPVGFTIIIGSITVKADAYDGETGISTVEFYVDDELKSTDSSQPYEWLWDETAFLKHRIKAVAKGFAGNTASIEKEVWIFNI
ncbi:MAG: hypothetical protein FE041_03795 [Thermoplasmata archaeon]|nr:MAG: hypothetical protein FE041_03795 [Thermoplasmata archaeon]